MGGRATHRVALVKPLTTVDEGEYPHGQVPPSKQDIKREQGTACCAPSSSTASLPF